MAKNPKPAGEKINHRKEQMVAKYTALDKVKDIDELKEWIKNNI